MKWLMAPELFRRNADSLRIVRPIFKRNEFDFAAARSAADLLLSNQSDRIRRCGECGWLFFDTSRNHLRRWCSMEICGNRAKARRHYERVKGQEKTSARA